MKQTLWVKNDKHSYFIAKRMELQYLDDESLNILPAFINVEKDIRLLRDILSDKPIFTTEKAQNLLKRLIIGHVRSLCGSYRKIRKLPHNLVFVLNPDAE